MVSEIKGKFVSPLVLESWLSKSFLVNVLAFKICCLTTFFIGNSIFKHSRKKRKDSLETRAELVTLCSILRTKQY